MMDARGGGGGTAGGSSRGLSRPRQSRAQVSFPVSVTDAPDVTLARLCVVCDRPLGVNPRQLTCGVRCRKALSRCGGLAGLADYLEELAGRWRRLKRVQRGAGAVAEELRARAARVRELVAA